MIYSAPRQGLFLLIISISFSMHTVVMMVSTENQVEKNRVQKGERLVAQLIDESALALTYEDRVSLSVIARRYTQEYDVNRIVISDINDDPLVQVGDAPLQEAGEVINKVATRNNAVIGKVEMVLMSTSMSEIAKMMWMTIFGSFFFHLMLWLVYNTVARPTKEQLRSLSREIQTYYFPDNNYLDPIEEQRRIAEEEENIELELLRLRELEHQLAIEQDKIAHREHALALSHLHIKQLEKNALNNKSISQNETSEDGNNQEEESQSRTGQTHPDYLYEKTDTSRTKQNIDQSIEKSIEKSILLQDGQSTINHNDIKANNDSSPIASSIIKATDDVKNKVSELFTKIPHFAKKKQVAHANLIEEKDSKNPNKVQQFKQKFLDKYNTPESTTTNTEVDTDIEIDTNTDIVVIETSVASKTEVSIDLDTLDNTLDNTLDSTLNNDILNNDILENSTLQDNINNSVIENEVEQDEAKKNPAKPVEIVDNEYKYGPSIHSAIENPDNIDESNHPLDSSQIDKQTDNRHSEDEPVKNDSDYTQDSSNSPQEISTPDDSEIHSEVSNPSEKVDTNKPYDSYEYERQRAIVAEEIQNNTASSGRHSNNAVFKKHSISKELSAFLAKKKQVNSNNGSRFRVQDTVKSQQQEQQMDSINVATEKPTTSSLEPDIPVGFFSTNKATPSIHSIHSNQYQSVISKSSESLQVKISFIDKYSLLNKLSDDMANSYLILCSQLLRQAVIELLKLPILDSISLVNKPVFDQEGAVVELQSVPTTNAEQNELALAGMMLAALYKMLNEIIYEKHREVGRFALTVAIGISQTGRENAMKKLLNTQASDHDVMMLLAKPEMKYIEKHIRVRRIPTPNNVSESECVYVKAIDNELLKQITKVRNSVLKAH